LPKRARPIWWAWSPPDTGAPRFLIRIRKTAEFRHFCVAGSRFRLPDRAIVPHNRRLDHKEQPAMQGDSQVIDYLNRALTNELTAINQYWLHYRVLANWGVSKLAEYERHESIDEMKHADKLADRVLFLEGLPNFQAIHKLKVGETVEEILRADLALEMEALPLLKDAIAHCESVRDFTSRELFAEILESEEEHVDFLEKQFDMIARMGLENYVQLQSKAAGED
jgi:bacterioferritin